MIELYRCFVPVNYIINDNHGTHYKVHMNCLNFLTNQFNRSLNNEINAPGNFHIPSLMDLSKYLSINFDEKINSLNMDQYPEIDIICEVWRPINRRFDPQNYAKTFKAPIDLLTKNGYIKDDSWQFVRSISYRGGGESVWNRHFSCINDGLPDNLTAQWWRNEHINCGLGVNNTKDDFNDILIRIMINK